MGLWDGVWGGARARVGGRARFGVPAQPDARRSDPSHRRNYYETLQVPRGASDAQIKRAYRKLALQFHPVRAADGWGRAIAAPAARSATTSRHAHTFAPHPPPP